MRQPDAAPLGAPGVYVVPQRRAAARLGVPMDECAFVGVAGRGPSWVTVEGDDGPERAQAVAVPVHSWDEYRNRYGAFEGPGLLPLAVSAYFEQGGRVAHIVRVVPHTPGPRTTLRFSGPLATTSGQPVKLRARDEGSWGNRLTAKLAYAATVLPLTTVAMVGRALPTGPAPLAAGAVLRIATTDGTVRTRVVESTMRTAAEVGRDWVAMLDQPVPGQLARIELVEAMLEVVDHDPELLRVERFEHAGLMPLHPRWLGTLVDEGSRLIDLLVPEGAGLVPDSLLTPVQTAAPVPVVDQFGAITHDDVLLAGVAAALGADDAASICVPDLYSPAPLPEAPDVEPPVSVAGPEFDECHPLRAVRQASTMPAPELTGLRLDPADRHDLDRITDLQAALVQAAEAARVVALLDVPPGLQVAAVQHWRRRFASSYAAAYHPWLLLPGDGLRGSGRLVPAPPSAVATGIIARTETSWGIPHGPANEPAKDVPDVTARIVEPEHGELHWSNVNVFAMQPGGVVLTGARTLSTEQSWRQLTARRVVTMVERAVARQLQWVVFEPNTATTRTVVATSVESLLLGLFRAGAFRGATPAESFFVRTDRGVDLGADGGQLLCEIGLAPSEPMEFLLLQVYREGDATVRAVSRRA